MLEQLKQEVLEANLHLLKYGLITFIWAMSPGWTGRRGSWSLSPAVCPMKA